MKTSTAIVIGVVGVAVVGGIAYLVHRHRSPGLPRPTTPADKAAAAFSSLIPFGSKIAALWSANGSGGAGAGSGGLNALSTSQFAALAAADASEGVEGPF